MSALASASFGRLTIVGTTHVDRSSIERVRKVIAEMHPSVVAVELDEERLWALKDPDRDKVGSPLSSGLLPWLLALLERSAGSLTEVFPGTEMLEAIEAGQRSGAQVAMIDKPIGVILEEVKRIPLLEKTRIGIDILTALLSIVGRQKTAQLKGVDIQKLLTEFDAKYPTLSRILVAERNRYMANRLRETLESTPGVVVAVVGLGHVNGIAQNMTRYPPATRQLPPGMTYEWTIRTDTSLP